MRPPLPSANPTSDTKMFSSTMLKQFIHLRHQLVPAVIGHPVLTLHLLVTCPSLARCRRSCGMISALSVAVYDRQRRRDHEPRREDEQNKTHGNHVAGGDTRGAELLFQALNRGWRCELVQRAPAGTKQARRRDVRGICGLGKERLDFDEGQERPGSNPRVDDLMRVGSEWRIIGLGRCATRMTVKIAHAGYRVRDGWQAALDLHPLLTAHFKHIDVRGHQRDPLQPVGAHGRPKGLFSRARRLRHELIERLQPWSL